VTALLRSKATLTAAIRARGRTVLMVNTRSRKGRRHYRRLPGRLAAAGVPVHTAVAIDDPARLHQALTEVLRVLGRTAYTLTALRRLPAHPPFKATLTVDGIQRALWTHQLNIANGAYHAGRRIARDASVDDRLLVVYRLGDAGRLQVTRQTLDQVVRGPRRPLEAGPYLTARELWVAPTRPGPSISTGRFAGPSLPASACCLTRSGSRSHPASPTPDRVHRANCA
jgi:hypothetical protein